jgi:hypothetical protein
LYVGALRSVEVPLMQQLLARFPLDSASSSVAPPGSAIPSAMPLAPTFGQLFRILNELRAMHCLEPFSQGPGIRFVRPFREEVITALRQAHPEIYCLIYEFLAQVYRERVQQRPISSNRSFNEWLYFSTALLLQNPNATARQEWQVELRSLFNRARLAGVVLLTNFYSDDELLEQLARLDVIDEIEGLFHEHQIINDQILVAMVPGTDLPLFITLYKHDVLQILHTMIGASEPAEAARSQSGGSKLPQLIRDFHDFENFLAFAALPKDGIDIRYMQERLDQEVPGPVISVLTFLNSHGFFQPERPQRRYRLHPLICHLVVGVTELVAKRIAAAAASDEPYG